MGGQEGTSDPDAVMVGIWDVLLTIITSGFWLIIIYCWPAMAITGQPKKDAQ